MPPPIKVQFQLADAQSLSSVFSNITKRVQDLEKAQQRESAVSRASMNDQKKALQEKHAYHMKVVADEMAALKRLHSEESALRAKSVAEHLRLSKQFVAAETDKYKNALKAAQDYANASSKLSNKTKLKWEQDLKKQALELARIDAGWGSVAPMRSTLLDSTKLKWQQDLKKQATQLAGIDAGWGRIAAATPAYSSPNALPPGAIFRREAAQRKDNLALAKIDAEWDRIAANTQAFYRPLSKSTINNWKKDLKADNRSVDALAGGWDAIANSPAFQAQANKMGHGAVTKSRDAPPPPPPSSFWRRPEWYKNATAGYSSSIWDSTVGTARRVLTGAGVMGGTYAMGRSISDAISLDHRAALLVNNTRLLGGEASFSREEILAASRSAASKYGTSAGDVLSGIETVAEKGKGAVGVKQFMSKTDDGVSDLEYLMGTAKAYGVTGKHMGAVAATVYNQGIFGKQARYITDSLVRMGIEGDIEIADSAKWLRNMVGPSLNFTKGDDAIRSSMAMAQIAAQVTGDPGKATAAIIDIVREGGMSPKINKLKAAKIDASENGREKDPIKLGVEIMDAIYKKKQYFGKGSAEGAWSYIYSGRSQGIMNPLRELYYQGGGEAVLKKYNDVKSTILPPSEREASLANVLSTPMTKISQAVENFNAEMARLVPDIGKLAESAGKMAASAAKFAIDNPKTAVATAVSGKLASDTISSVVSNAVKNSPLLAGGLSIAALALTATTVTLHGMNYMDERDKDNKEAGGKLLKIDSELDTLRGSAANGKLGYAEGLSKVNELRKEAELAKSPMDKFWESGGFFGSNNTNSTTPGVDGAASLGSQGSSGPPILPGLLRFGAAAWDQVGWKGGAAGSTVEGVKAEIKQLEAALEGFAGRCKTLATQINGTKIGPSQDFFPTSGPLANPESRRSPAMALPK